MHYANAVQRFNEADISIEYIPAANGIAQYNVADSMSVQPTATCPSSSLPLTSRESLDFSLKAPETMQNTINTPSSLPPFMSSSIVGAPCNSLHSSSSGGVPTACYMVYPHHGSILNTAQYPVAQSATPYSTMDPSTVQQITYPTPQSVSSNFQGIGDNSGPSPLHTAQPSNLLLGGSCGHQALQPSSTVQPSSSHFFLVRSGLTSLSIAATTQIAYPDDSSALLHTTSHLHPAQYSTGTPQTNICYTFEGSAPPSFSSTSYSSTIATAGDVTNPSDGTAPCSQYQQPYPSPYSVPMGSENCHIQLTSLSHGQSQVQSPIIRNDSGPRYPSGEQNRGFSSTGLLGPAGHTLPISAPIYNKFPPTWSGHNLLSSPSNASPTHSISSGHQEFMVGSHCNISSTTVHSSTSTSPTTILTPHSDSTAYLSDQRSLSHSEPQSPLSPYQQAPGSQYTPVSPQYSEYSPAVHQSGIGSKGLPSNLQDDGADVPVVDGNYAGRSPLLPIYNVAHDRSMPSSHTTCQSLSHRCRRGVHFAPSYPALSSSPSDPSVTHGHSALTMPVHPYYGNRSQRCFGACCIVEHDPDDSDEPHTYAFIHNARETKKRPRRKFVSHCSVDPVVC